MAKMPARSAAGSVTQASRTRCNSASSSFLLSALLVGVESSPSQVAIGPSLAASAAGLRKQSRPRSQFVEKHVFSHVKRTFGPLEEMPFYALFWPFPVVCTTGVFPNLMIAARRIQYLARPCTEPRMLDTAHEHRCSIAGPGLEVVTVRTEDGTFETQIHGGRLDGERFVCAEDADGQHEAAVVMVRLVAKRIVAGVIAK
jgi:hypothetical protein